VSRSDTHLTHISEALVDLKFETIRGLLHDGEMRLDEARARYDLAWQLLATLAGQLPKSPGKSRR